MGELESREGLLRLLNSYIDFFSDSMVGRYGGKGKWIEGVTEAAIEKIHLCANEGEVNFHRSNLAVRCCQLIDEKDLVFHNDRKGPPWLKASSEFDEKLQKHIRYDEELKEHTKKNIFLIITGLVDYAMLDPLIEASALTLVKKIRSDSLGHEIKAYVREATAMTRGANIPSIAPIRVWGKFINFS